VEKNEDGVLIRGWSCRMAISTAYKLHNRFQFWLWPCQRLRHVAFKSV